MADRSIILLLVLFCFLFRNHPCYSITDTLHQGQELKDWDELTSSNRVFSLKLFSFGTMMSPYSGIFYNYNDKNNIRIHYSDDLRKRAVWVANRNNPIPDMYGKLTIDVHRKLNILSGGTVVDLFNPTSLVTRNASAKLLDTGNLVLQEVYRDGSVKQVLWQSFDYPTDTLLQEVYRDGSVRLYYISNETEQSFTYLTKTYDLFSALRMTEAGELESSTLNSVVFCALTSDYALAKFEKLKCRKDYIFQLGQDYHFPSTIYEERNIYVDEYEYDEIHNLTLYDCKRICWTNCSCVAYSFATKNRTGCKTYGKKLYNPAEADQDTEYYTFVHRGKAKKIKNLLLHQMRHFYNYVRKDKNISTEQHYFTFQSISFATNNFSSSNKLGEGGFGSVYKGKLVDGQEVAVKRLSRNSVQGVKEFKNETELIAKLQHINLVRLLGCCVEKQEKILVYEYMPNNSLDFFLFDPRRKGLLGLNSRFVIIDGIAQGLLYLQKFSRLRVIHRDLKASNILQDDYMKPKISDFGMAKLFGMNDSEVNTTRVVGTRGYMLPEYMMEGTISNKTDVFSFGVLLLEIVSSKMNHRCYDSEHPLNLLGLAWELWNQGRGLELMDPELEDSRTPKEVMNCIHVGLLCVQDHAMDRPTMSEVISMLTNENMNIPEPKRPAFFIERHNTEAGRGENLENGSVNGQSISILVAR